MARSMSGRVQASGSSLTAALPPARLTVASRTPGSPRSAFSLVIPQGAPGLPAPPPPAVSPSPPPSNYFLVLSASLRPRNQLVQTLALGLQLLDDLRGG